MPARWVAKFDAALKVWSKKRGRPTCVACGYGFDYMLRGLEHMPIALIVVECIEAMNLLGVCRACLRLTDEQLLEVAFEDLKWTGITSRNFGSPGHA
jgi:hypothetical protein